MLMRRIIYLHLEYSSAGFVFEGITWKRYRKQVAEVLRLRGRKAVQNNLLLMAVLAQKGP